ncbi:MAG: hypothetical protein A2252_08790 [Elusimicrobia bacterium RIFOXYA2_FULL_39_19]|nr:MAG: hypothetical protein A2252_08790 [Elusimicrobia bacterium RIFOXYA2_FULL_39_19]
MKKNIFALLFISIGVLNAQESGGLSFSTETVTTFQGNEPLTIQKSSYDKDIQGLIEDLKNNKINANIAIYYIEKTIIKEGPKDEYLEHLLQSLKDNLKKGKKEGKIRRIENNLVEIDKGSIHKVRERDIYNVFDSTTGKYKGKLEVDAIADAVSIGSTYNRNKYQMNKDDKIKYYGQRKVFGLGVIGGGTANEFPSATKQLDLEKHICIRGAGLLWEWSFKNGWGVQWLLGSYVYKTAVPNRTFIIYQDPYTIFKKRIDNQYEIELMSPVIFKKNFFYPSTVSPYLGLGIGYLRNQFYNYIFEDYFYYDQPNYYHPGHIVDSFRKITNNDTKEIQYLLPFPVIGIEFFSSHLVHITFDAKYIYPLVPLRGTTEDHSWNGWIFSTGMTTNW